MEYKTWEWSQLRISGKSRPGISKKEMLSEVNIQEKVFKAEPEKVPRTAQYLARCGYQGHILPTSGLLFSHTGQLGHFPNNWCLYTSMPWHGLFSLPESPNFPEDNLLLCNKFIKHPLRNLPFSGQRQSFPLLSHLFCRRLLHNLKALLHWFITISFQNSHSVHTSSMMAWCLA